MYRGETKDRKVDDVNVWYSIVRYQSYDALEGKHGHHAPLMHAICGMKLRMRYAPDRQLSEVNQAASFLVWQYRLIVPYCAI